MYREKKIVVRKTKDSSENGDNWDKILEETWEGRILGKDREVTSRKIKRTMSFTVMRWNEQKLKWDFWGGEDNEVITLDRLSWFPQKVEGQWGNMSIEDWEKLK